MGWVNWPWGWVGWLKPCWAWIRSISFCTRALGSPGFADCCLALATRLTTIMITMKIANSTVPPGVQAVAVDCQRKARRGPRAVTAESRNRRKGQVTATIRCYR